MPEQWKNFKLLIINSEMLNTFNIQPNFLHVGQAQFKTYSKET
jgi:hypothetical protein